MRPCEFSPNRLYRYVWRREVPGKSGRVVFVMLNPSTADENTVDPTVRRCFRFARDWDFSRIDVVNLFAWRSTDPRVLTADLVGKHNDYWIAKTLRGADRVVAAWGSHGDRHIERVHRVGAMLPGNTGCLGTTKTGQPRHPLYLAADTTLRRWP
jgi:hypothetical protein